MLIRNTCCYMLMQNAKYNLLWSYTLLLFLPTNDNAQRKNSKYTSANSFCLYPKIILQVNKNFEAPHYTFSRLIDTSTGVCSSSLFWQKGVLVAQCSKKNWPLILRYTTRLSILKQYCLLCDFKWLDRSKYVTNYWFGCTCIDNASKDNKNNITQRKKYDLGVLLPFWNTKTSWILLRGKKWMNSGMV